MIKIIAIGKKHESWVLDGIERYSKRLQAPWNIEWVLLPHSTLEGSQARHSESQAILDKLKSSDHVILLDERGTPLDSPALAVTCERLFSQGKDIVIIIGGAYGVTDALHSRAQLVWSLSPLVFPHQLVRLILTEQLYRAQGIASGHPYHHL